jgi:uncharacterized membrane protein
MSEQEFGSIPPGHDSNPGPVASEPGWGAPPPNYTQGQSAPPPPPGYVPPAAVAPGLSENTACALAYVTFIPALIFLLVPPYNQSAKIRFHAIQELGLSVVWMCLSIIFVVPILGWLVGMLGFLCLLVLWVMCILKASQGGVFKLPVLGDFAAQQSGYTI